MPDYNSTKETYPQKIAGSNFLVTGGAGFIGSHIVEYLLVNGAKKVRVLDNLATGSLQNIQPFMNHPAFEFMEADIREIEVCKKASLGIDYISHQAALGSVPRSISDPVTTNDVNIGGHLNMLLAAQQANVKRMVYAASSSTYGDSPFLPKMEDRIGKPLSPYAVTKYVNELYAEVFASLYNIKIIGLRYFNVFGPKQNPQGPYAAVIPLFMEAAINNQAPNINGDGLQTRDFTYIENVVQANINALLKENISGDSAEVFNIAVGEQTSLLELWNMISKMASCSVKPTHLPPREGDVRNSLASIEKASILLDYHPKIKIEEGLKISFEYLKNNKSK